MLILGNGIDARTGNKVMLLQATANEVANVCGFDWEGQGECPKLVPGTIIKVSTIYTKLNVWRTKSRAVTRAREEVQHVLEALGKLEPYIEQLVTTE